jgi:hypothetical protein
MDEKKEQKTSLPKRILKWILLTVLLVILLFALIGLWTWKVQNDYESTAVPYLRAVVPEIATWDPDILWANFDEEVKGTINRDEYDKVIKYFSTLGSLESLGHPEFRQVTSSATIRTGTNKFVVYQIPAEFENGDATINVTLLDLEGEFSIASFKIDSMAFAERAIQEDADKLTVDETGE